MTVDVAVARRFIDRMWDEEVIPQLAEYIKIPNKSPAFDPDWAAHGHMDAAVALMSQWAEAHLVAIPGATLEVVRLPGRTPLIFIDVPASGDASSPDEGVLLYGHLDKQPEMTGWREGLGPWTPVRDGDRLYGRGAADDGYALFGALSALLALAGQGLPRARCVVMIEACEESGSYDLPHYVNHLRLRIGSPSLVVCLDSGCADYDRLWLTTSLRGMVGGVLTVRVLTEGVHSGDASGVVPDSFRILRQLLSRLEDAETGTILPQQFSADIPVEHIEQARQCAGILGPEVFAKFPWGDGCRPVSDDPVELILNRAWRPQLTVTGAADLPALADAGNVLRPRTALKLSLRLPPTVDAVTAGAAMKRVLEVDPPLGAQVVFEPGEAGNGWNAPPLSEWLQDTVAHASEQAFGAPAASMGEGGSIPFMGMLGEKFPRAQFVVTGVLGPHSNAHGPNEFLHIPTAKKVSLVVASIVAAHARATSSPPERIA